MKNWSRQWDVSSSTFDLQFQFLVGLLLVACVGFRVRLLKEAALDSFLPTSQSPRALDPADAWLLCPHHLPHTQTHRLHTCSSEEACTSFINAQPLPAPPVHLFLQSRVCRRKETENTQSALWNQTAKGAAQNFLNVTQKYVNSLSADGTMHVCESDALHLVGLSWWGFFLFSHKLRLGDPKTLAYNKLMRNLRFIPNYGDKTVVIIELWLRNQGSCTTVITNLRYVPSCDPKTEIYTKMWQQNCCTF